MDNRSENKESIAQRHKLDKEHIVKLETEKQQLEKEIQTIFWQAQVELKEAKNTSASKHGGTTVTAGTANNSMAHCSSSTMYNQVGSVTNVHPAQINQPQLVVIHTPSITLSTTPQSLLASSSSSSQSALITSTETKKLWHLPEPTQYFTGREAQLKEIHQKLSTQNTAVVTQVIVGTGGIGKTQTALRYAQEHEQDYSGGIWWFNAETQEQLYSGYQDLAKALGLSIDNLERDTVIRIVKAKLMQQPSMLLIYDNATKTQDIEKYLISSEKANFHGIQHRELITSRNRGLQDWNPKLLVTLPLFSKDEAVKFILDTLEAIGNTPETRASAELLAEELGYLPLALKIAVYSMQGSNIAAYLESYRKSSDSRKELFQDDKNADNYNRTIMNTWNMSIAQIRKELANAKEQFANLEKILHWMAYLDSNDIPVQLFAKTIGSDLAKILKILHDHSLLERSSLSGGYTYNMHRLLQKVIRVEDGEQKAELPQQRLLLLKGMLENYYVWDKRSAQDFALAKQLIPHCSRIIEHLQPFVRVIKGQDNTFALAQVYVLAITGDMLGALGDAKGQKALLERSLKIEEAHYGMDHPEVAKILTNLGCALVALGDAKGAKALLERALKIEEAHYGGNHSVVAQILMNLGCALVALGDAKRAKALLERALKIKEAHYGENHPEVAKTLTNLGCALGDLGDAKGQKALLERALKIKEAHYGENHPEVARTLGSLGNALGALGDAKGQKALLERALKINEAHYGENHPEVARTLGSLGDALGDLGDAKGKKTLLERALKINEAHYGENHPVVAQTLTNLGHVLRDLNEAQLSKALLERALKIKEENFAHSSSSIGFTLLSLGAVLRELGEVKKSKKLLEEASGIFRVNYGNAHNTTAVALTYLGDTLRDLGDLDHSKQSLEEALKTLEAFYGRSHQEIAITLKSLGDTFGALGDKAQQKARYEQALRVVLNIDGYNPNSPLVQNIKAAMQKANISIPQDCLTLIAAKSAIQPETASSSASTTEIKDTKSSSSTSSASNAPFSLSASTAGSLQSFQATAATATLSHSLAKSEAARALTYGALRKIYLSQPRTQQTQQANSSYSSDAASSNATLHSVNSASSSSSYFSTQIQSTPAVLITTQPVAADTQTEEEPDLQSGTYFKSS